MIKPETLVKVLCKELNAQVISSDFEENQLQGGTLGDVRLVSGIAKTANGTKLPYRIVLKTQKKWTRPGDPDSWRREFDLNTSDFGAAFAGSLSWPKCYHAELSGDEIQLWLEYIDAVSGNDLTIEMLEKAAYELGCFQGRLHAQPQLTESITCFGDIGYMQRDYMQWRNTREYKYLRNDLCDIPPHLKQMISEIDDNFETVFAGIGKLPVVLCHRDFWIENIMVCGDEVRLIDWDTCGWGYLGEDIASLIADDVDFANFEEYCSRLIPAYYKGVSEHMNISSITTKYVREMILIKFGYRMVQANLFTTSQEVKDEQVAALQKIYDFV